MAFHPATRDQLKARIALCGPSGAGKSLTALRWATCLAGSGGRVAVIDTEHRSASKYAGEVYDGQTLQFAVNDQLPNYSPMNYVNAIRDAGNSRYDVLVIDSLSHAWDGVGGALEQVDKKSSGNKFTAWRDVTPQHRQLVEAILGFPGHILCTLRVKMEYSLERNERGKMVPIKVGLAPIQRAGVDYEFDVVVDIDVAHQVTVSKTRCPAIDGLTAVSPGGEFIQPLVTWLEKGTPVITPISDGQRDIIINAAKSMGIPPESLQGIVQRRMNANGQPCRKLAELTNEQAEEIIHNLQQMAVQNGAPASIPF